MRLIHTLPILLFPCLFVMTACKKEAGPGGTSTIKGRIHADYYNKNYSILTASGYAPDVDVYIIYGNEGTYGNKQKTSFDGTYEFKYLQQGTYKIYTYSKDTTGAHTFQPNTFAPNVAVVQTAEVTKRNQTVQVIDMNIIK